jgi:hypothetical protein
MRQTAAVELVLESPFALCWPSQSGGAAIPAMTSNTNTDVDKLIPFGQMALKQGWYDKAREYFGQALALDPSNREALKGLARVNEVLSRKAAMAVEPIQVEPVKPPPEVEREWSISEKKRQGQELRGGANASSTVSIPLWDSLSQGERYRHLCRFLHLDPSRIASLSNVEFALLMQWIFELRALKTTAVEHKSSRLDFVLVNTRYNRHEFARVFYRERGVPINALPELLNHLKGTHFKRMHVFTVGTFSKAQQRTQSEFPLALKIKEGKDLQRYVREAQHIYRQQLERRGSPRPAGVPSRRKTVWSSMRQRLMVLLRGSR